MVWLTWSMVWLTWSLNLTLLSLKWSEWLDRWILHFSRWNGLIDLIIESYIILVEMDWLAWSLNLTLLSLKWADWLDLWVFHCYHWNGLIDLIFESYIILIADVWQQVSMLHEWKHNERHVLLVESDALQSQDVWMVELPHPEGFLQELAPLDTGGVRLCVCMVCQGWQRSRTYYNTATSYVVLEVTMPCSTSTKHNTLQVTGNGAVGVGSNLTTTPVVSNNMLF